MFAQVSGPVIVLPYLDQVVYINGRRYSSIYCTGINRAAGTAGSSAQFTLPAAYWDDPKSHLRGAFVRVLAGYRGSSKSTVFAGYVSQIGSEISGQTMVFSAQSLIGFANKVYVGDANPSDGMEIKYPRYAFNNGVKTKTGWDAKQILRDIFNSSVATWRGGGGSISSQWRSKLKLGNLSAFDDAGQIETPDIEFYQESLSSALDKLLALYGNISFYETYSSNETTLNFFQLGSKEQAKSLYVLPREEAGTYSNILNLSKDEGYNQSISRMIGIGGKRQFLVSLFSDSGTTRLEKAWDRSLDVAALANPIKLLGKAGANGSDDANPSFDHRYQFVYRQYKIPASLLNNIIREAGFEINGNAVSVQLFGFPYLMTEATGSWTGTLATTPVQIDGDIDLETGLITLKDPAVCPFSATYNNLTKQTTLVYREMQIGITLILSLGNLYADLKSGNVDLNGFDEDGIKETIKNDSFRFMQLTNIGYPIGGATFGSVWYNAPTGWISATTATEIRNDLPQFLAFCGNALREKNNFSQSYEIEMPYYSTSYQIGDNVTIQNENNKSEYGKHQIMSMSLSLTNDHKTMISTENNAGMHNNGIVGV